MDTYTLDIPLVPPSLNVYTRMHWSKRNSLQFDWDLAVMVLCHEAEVKSLEKIHLNATIYFKTNRRRDVDNQITVYKLAQDSLIKAGVIPDDHAGVVSWSAPLLSVDKESPRTVLTITPR